MTAKLYAHLSDEVIYVLFENNTSNVSQEFSLPELAKNLINSQMMVSEGQRLEALKAFNSAKESMEQAIKILDQGINDYSEQVISRDGKVD